MNNHNLFYEIFTYIITLLKKKWSSRHKRSKFLTTTMSFANEDTLWSGDIFYGKDFNRFISVVEVSKYLSSTEIWKYKEEAKLDSNIWTNIPIIPI